MKALLSVSNKKDLDRFGLELSNIGYELYATPGTAEFLLSKGIKVHRLEEITGFSQLADGRVKTLNEKIFEMILSRRGGFDLVVVNLYPFAEVIDQGIDAMIENFDIGGVALMRAAAKNYEKVSIVPSPDLYEWFCTNIPLDIEKRKFLAKEAMETVIEYDSIILHNLFNSHFNVVAKNLKILRYGENPHQQAWIGKVAGMPSILDNIKLVKGDLSYNNYLDLITAIQVVSDCEEGTMVITKHTNPCGMSIFMEDSITTFQRTLGGDPQSAYGGVLCINDRINRDLAQAIKPYFFDLIIAKEIPKEALSVFEHKKAVLIEFNPIDSDTSLEWKVSNGVVLIQQPDVGNAYDNLEFLTKRKPSTNEMEDIKVGLKIVRYVKSNAIILVRDGMLIGVGAGQASRVDSVKIALEKAKKYGHSIENSVMISDGFFPFTDSVELGIENGIKCFVEPGGSKRDKEVIELCDKNNITLIFTGKRLFKH